MEKAMKMFCAAIHMNQLAHYTADIWLNNLCIEYGAEAVATWLMDNDKEAIEWLNQGAA